MSSAHRSFADPYGDLQRKPREISQFGKKSAKEYHSLYSSTEQLQVALWTYIFLWLGLNNEKSIHTLPLRSVPFLSFHLYSLPLQTLRLVSLVSFIIKTKRIAVRSAIVTHTHTQSHTDRQSTQGKYICLIIFSWGQSHGAQNSSSELKRYLSVGNVHCWGK